MAITSCIDARLRALSRSKREVDGRIHMHTSLADFIDASEEVDACGNVLDAPSLRNVAPSIVW